LGRFQKIDTTKLRWKVTYDDDSILWEVDPKTRKESRFTDIDQSKLKTLDLMLPIDKMEDVLLTETDVQVKTLDDKPAIVTLKVYNREVLPYFRLQYPKGAKLILARRQQNTTGKKIAVFQVKGGEQKIAFPVPASRKIIIIGWQLDKHRVLNYIYPDGHIELDFQSRKDADHSAVDMPVSPGDVIELENSTSIDAHITAEPRSGLPDDVTT